MLLADASSLIVLAKLRRLELLYDLYGKVLIGPVVKAETIEAGHAIRARGVEQLENARASGGLQMACPRWGTQLHGRLGVPLPVGSGQGRGHRICEHAGPALDRG